MSHLDAAPVGTLSLYRLEHFSAKAVMVKTDMTSDLLSVYFCLALLLFFFFFHTLFCSLFW